MTKQDLLEENRFDFRANNPASPEEHALIVRNEGSATIQRHDDGECV
jgi:hypothetical protein